MPAQAEVAEGVKTRLTLRAPPLISAWADSVVVTPSLVKKLR